MPWGWLLLDLEVYGSPSLLLSSSGVADLDWCLAFPSFRVQIDVSAPSVLWFQADICLFLGRLIASWSWTTSLDCLWDSWQQSCAWFFVSDLTTVTLYEGLFFCLNIGKLLTTSTLTEPWGLFCANFKGLSLNYNYIYLTIRRWSFDWTKGRWRSNITLAEPWGLFCPSFKG